MKILASILAVTSADYACCPYDDFGVVYSGCPLTEKTPWSDASGVENNACKAWEANIDATMEGNSDKDNWGGCGFQRHFPWSMKELPNSGLDATGALTQQHCTLGMLSSINCGNAPLTDGTPQAPVKSSLYTNLNVFAIGTTTPQLASFPLSGATGSFSASGNNVIFGRVTLGAICKLFIPVDFKHIETVSIAGVHMNFGGVLAAQLTSTGTAVRTGTAYCFTVVNVAEYMENINLIGNANVAGLNANVDTILNNDQTSDQLTPQFGDSLVDTETTGAQGEPTFSSGGANFDVVVHFKSAWCIRHWTIVDMQTGGDNGHQDIDYDLASDSGTPQHAHTDVADKRFQAGIDGCGDGTNSHNSLASDITPSALGCGVYTDSTLVKAINTYIPTESFKWPNAGAWAAFYSFISCSDINKMVYTDQVSNGASPPVFSEAKRMLVLSSFSNDFRHQGVQRTRGNIRQVGSEVKTCGEGQLRDDVAGQRCTWNWNFGTAAAQTAGLSFQHWFESTNPYNFNAWNQVETAPASGVFVSQGVDRNSEPHAFDTDNTNTNPGEGYFASVFDDFTFDLKLNTHVEAGTTSLATIGDITTVEFDDEHITIETKAGVTGLVTVACVKTADTATTNVRDIFPDCFMGDEIHFQFAVADNEYVTSWFSQVTVV